MASGRHFAEPIMSVVGFLSLKKWAGKCNCFAGDTVFLIVLLARERIVWTGVLPCSSAEGLDA